MQIKQKKIIQNFIKTWDVTKCVAGVDKIAGLEHELPHKEAR
jgi:hypothetical protein